MSELTFEELKTLGSLPTPTGVGMQILRMTQQEEFSTEEVGRVISTDPALAGRLLALANSAESGAAEPITSINEAMMRLGIRAVRNVALGLSLVSGYRQGTCTAFDYDGYWARSLARAVAAQRLAHALRVGGPAEAYILGLLADIGSLALASVYPIAYGELLVSQEVSSREDFARAEEHRFAITHRKISGEMLLEWGLPEGFSRAVRDYEEYDLSAAPPGLSETTALLRAADAVAGLMVADEDLSGEVWRSLFQEFSLVERLSGLDREPFRAHCNAAMKAWADWGGQLAIPAGSQLDFHRLEIEVQRARLRAPRPAPARPAPVAAKEAAPGAQPERLRVLAVDDDPVSLKVLERHLAGQGLEVRTARDGLAAEGIVLEWSPEIIVADWHMPGLDGLELCRRVRSLTNGDHVHYLLLTGSEGEDSLVQAFEAQISDYVTKPFSPRVLMARLTAGVRQVRTRRELVKARQEMFEQNNELQIARRKLTTAVETDDLTGLKNRRHAMERMRQGWSNAERTGNPFSLIVIDVDHFKRINDAHGHDVGDLVLQELASRFRAVTRDEEVVCRLGGEEFLVVCSNTTLGEAHKVAERIRKVVRDTPFQLPGGPQRITLSLGVATRTPRMESFMDLLKVADVAVYSAKEGGRDRIVAEGEALGGDDLRRIA